MKRDQAAAEFDAFVDDFFAERSARILIIVGASRIDQLLVEILGLYLLPKSAKKGDPDELLEGDKPLSPFSARIKMCFRLGLIDRSLFRSLERLRVLRNSCAHSVVFNIAKSPMREHFFELRTSIANRPSFRLTKERYFAGTQFKGIEELRCLLLTLCVLLEAIREKTTTTSGRKIALKIAAR